MNPLDRPASGGNGPPTDVPASAVVMELISRGRPPSVVMDFPRHDERAERGPVKAGSRRLFASVRWLEPHAPFALQHPHLQQASPHRSGEPIG